MGREGKGTGVRGRGDGVGKGREGKGTKGEGEEGGKKKGGEGTEGEYRHFFLYTLSTACNVEESFKKFLCGSKSREFQN